MEKIKEMPVIGQLITILDRYPRISAWGVLSAGIIILLVREAQDQGLTTGNWIALIVASILVSGLCIWIVSWEDEEDPTATQAPVLRVKSEKVEEEKPAEDAAVSDLPNT